MTNKPLGTYYMGCILIIGRLRGQEVAFKGVAVPVPEISVVSGGFDPIVTFW